MQHRQNLEDYITNTNITDPVFCAIQKYEKYPSILKIKEMRGTSGLSFSFKFIDRRKMKKDLENVENYRPVRILTVLSKVYQRCMYDQMYAYCLLIMTNMVSMFIYRGDKWSITNSSFKSF